MNNSDSNLIQNSSSSSEFTYVAASNEAARAECCRRLALVQQCGIDADMSGEVVGIIRAKVEQAKRFYKSDEFGACEYELDAVEKLLNAGK